LEHQPQSLLTDLHYDLRSGNMADIQVNLLHKEIENYKATISPKMWPQVQKIAGAK
jgi:hypothetical protein